MNSLQNNLVPFVPFVQGASSTISTNEHRYSLEKGSKKHLCPNCGKKSLKRYIDIETGDYLPEQYGRCDHENSCVPHYHLNPYLDGYAKAIREQEQGNRSELPNNWKPQRKNAISQPKPIFFDFDTFKQTLQSERYEKNTFIQNLLHNVKHPLEADEVTKIIQLYRLGTIANGYRAGANTFPFIDTKDNVRAIQVKQFNEQNHTIGTDFLHSIIEKHHTRNNKPLPEWLEAYINQDKKISCLFGEHLLSKYHSNPVYLFEAPKTAVYATLYFGHPEISNVVCLAVYNKSSFSYDKLKVLRGRFVYVFPDLSKDGSTYKEWETKAKDYESRLPGTRFIFSDLLERLAPEPDKSEGNDLADYLIKQDWRLFRKRNIQEQPPQPVCEKVTKVTHLQNIIFSHDEPLPEDEIFKIERILHPIKEKLPFKIERILHPINEQHQDWSNDIAELETYFANIELPTAPVRLNKCSTITDCSLFIENHFVAVKGNNGKRTFLPYLDRLKELKQILSS